MAPPQKFHMFLKFEVFLWMPHVPLLVCIQGFGNSRKLGNGLLSWSMKLLNFWWVSFAWSLLSPSSCPLIFSFIIIIIKKYKFFHANKQDTMYQCHDLKMLNKLLRSCTMWDLGHGLRRLLSTLAAACYQCWWNLSQHVFFSQESDCVILQFLSSFVNCSIDLIWNWWEGRKWKETGGPSFGFLQSSGISRKISGHWLLYDLVADVATWCQDME